MGETRIGHSVQPISLKILDEKTTLDEEDVIMKLKRSK